ncbi:MAG: hypothetical protein JJU28_21420 [Cyclobacteriaceae bacterium]|nr:hypothetical protein [Cyclobacteriaceae bacterium]
MIYKEKKFLITFSLAMMLFALTEASARIHADTLNLTPWVVQAGDINVYDISGRGIFVNRKGEFTFHQGSLLPAGIEFPENGALAWWPTDREFESLRSRPISILFEARHKNSSKVIIGSILVLANVEPEDPTATTEVQGAVTAAPATRSIFDSVSLVLPAFNNWNSISEGDAFSFKLDAKGGSGSYVFSSENPDRIPFSLETNGYFYWEPGFDFVKSQEESRTARVIFKVEDTEGRKTRKEIPLTIYNTNRPPVINELPNFFLRYEVENVYQLKIDRLIYDPDGDPIVFNPVLSTLPQGMRVSPSGEVRWKPSSRQYSNLRREPIEIEFHVEDVHGLSSKGKLRVQASEEDLPPQITMVPNRDTIRIKENELLNLAFYLTDPNGDDDIAMFDFISDNKEIQHSALNKVSQTHYTFSWFPGFEFVMERGATKSFTITFFAVDQGNHRASRTLYVAVTDAENIEELDRLAYMQYRTILSVGWDLIEQLNNKEREVRREYRKARNGRKNRAITNASLGAITGLSPVFMEGEPQKITAGVGGTATATLGTLEASNVVGRSATELMQQWNSIATKRNDIVVYGNVFATKYAQREERRKGSFANDLNNLNMQMVIQDAHRLELDATWVNPKTATDRNIQSVFKDFYPDSSFKTD